MKNKINLDFKKFFNSSKAVTVAVAVGLIGIFLIVLSDFIGDDKTETEVDTAKGVVSDEEYRLSLEQTVKELVMNITGDKGVEAAVTLSCGTEYVYATEKSVDTDSKENKESNTYNNEMSDKTEESYIIINTGSGEQPLLLSTAAPEVRGVAVVCESGYDETVCQKITEALTVLLDISESDISICGRRTK